MAISDAVADAASRADSHYALGSVLNHVLMQEPQAMERLVRDSNAPALVIVAPPRTLADIRAALHADVASRVIAEINKDLTRHPVGEIEKRLTGSD